MRISPHNFALASIGPFMEEALKAPKSREGMTLKSIERWFETGKPEFLADAAVHSSLLGGIPVNAHSTLHDFYERLLRISDQKREVESNEQVFVERARIAKSYWGALLNSDFVLICSEQLSDAAHRLNDRKTRPVRAWIETYPELPALMSQAMKKVDEAYRLRTNAGDVFWAWAATNAQTRKLGQALSVLYSAVQGSPEVLKGQPLIDAALPAGVLHRLHQLGISPLEAAHYSDRGARAWLSDETSKAKTAVIESLVSDVAFKSWHAQQIMDANTELGTVLVKATALRKQFALNLTSEFCQAPSSSVEKEDDAQDLELHPS